MTDDNEKLIQDNLTAFLLERFRSELLAVEVTMKSLEQYTQASLERPKNLLFMHAKNGAERDLDDYLKRLGQAVHTYVVTENNQGGGDTPVQ